MIVRRVYVKQSIRIVRARANTLPSQDHAKLKIALWLVS